MDSDRLPSICAGLGLAVEDEDGAITGYAKGEYCLDSLRDLQRFLRRDDPDTRDIFKQICKWNTVSRDLIPIIEFHQNERNLVITSVKILVLLTMPVDPNSYDIAQQIEHLWELKSKLARNITIAVIISLLEDPLEHLESDVFTEEDWKLVQLILTLFRNLLAIREITLHQKSCGAASQLSQLAGHFLEILFKENVMDIILLLTQHLDESCGFIKHDSLLFLEIFHHIFVGRDPEMIAKFGVVNIMDGLKSIREKEVKKRKELELRSLEMRSRFGGTFTRLLMDGSKTVHVGKPSSDGLSKANKIQRGPQKRIASDPQIVYSPNDNVLESLKSFIEQFLSGGYNVLMRSIRNDIKKEHHSIQNNDVITFFQVVQFVLAFQYHRISVSKKNKEKGENLNICGPVAETINEEMFNLVINRFREIFEGIKQTNDYKSLSSCISLMKHMIFMIDLVLKLERDESKEAHTSRVLLYKLFYDQTEQGLTHFVLNLFKSFDMHKQHKSDLADLLEIIHVILRLMESLQERGTIRVAKKARRIKKKKTPKTLNPSEPSRTSDNQQNPTMDPTEPSRTSENPPTEESNPAVGPTEPSRSSENQQNPTVDPREPSRTLENPPTEESNPVVDPTEESNPAVAPTEPSRSSENQHNPTVDPTEPSRTSENLPTEESNPVVQPTEESNPAVGPTEPSRSSEDPVLGTEQETAGSSSESEEEEEDEMPATNEVDFRVSRLVTSFVNNTVVDNLCWLLKHYESNSVRTNHYIVCFLRRICDDLGMTAMLYQLSLLTIFQQILSEQKHSKSKEFSTIVNFLTKLVRDMMKLFAKQPLLFVKILFWKTRRECHYISADALISDAGNVRRDMNGSFGTETGTGTGFGFSRSIADSLGDDEADLVPNYDATQREDTNPDGINRNEEDKTVKSTTKRRRLKKSIFENKEENNDNSASVKVVNRRRKSLFNPEQETIIKDLFEKHKEDRKCCRIIAEALDPNGDVSPVQILRKLKQLGLRKLATRKKKAELESPVPLSTDDDDEIPLTSLITRRKRTKGTQINELDSDNETLGSIFRKKSKSQIETKSPVKEPSIDPIDLDSQDNLDDYIEYEPDKIKSPDFKINLLDDFDDEMDSPVLKSTGSKRSLKMVFDDDDGDI